MKPGCGRSGAGAAGLGAFAAEIGGDDFHGAAHFEEAGTHAAAYSLFERIFTSGHDELSAGKACGFAFLSRIVVVVCGDDGGEAVVVACIQDDADDVADPVGGLAGSEIVKGENFDGADRFENSHFGGFAGGVVTGLDFLQKFTVIAEEAGVSAADQIFQRRDSEMGFADARGAHEKKALLSGARVITNKSLSQQLGFFQGVCLLGRCTDVGAVAFKIAVLVALGNVGALDDALGTLLHAAIAGDGDSACGSVGTRDELPTRASAKRAILESHADSIRLGRLDRKLSALGKLWKNESYKVRIGRGVERTMAWRCSLSCERDEATRESSCWTTLANSDICFSISTSFSRMLRMISMPARLTPMSRARVRITSRRSRSESV